MNTEQLKRFETSIITPEDIYHEIAENYMISMTIKYGGLKMGSLDDFLCDHCEELKYEDLKLGESILKLFEL